MTTQKQFHELNIRLMRKLLLSGYPGLKEAGPDILDCLATGDTESAREALHDLRTPSDIEFDKRTLSAEADEPLSFGATMTNADYAATLVYDAFNRIDQLKTIKQGILVRNEMLHREESLYMDVCNGYGRQFGPIKAINAQQIINLDLAINEAFTLVDRLLCGMDVEQADPLT